MPKLSVIMGVYNCKNTELLQASVYSIINQTYENWEFIICNDGSNDSTLEKLLELEKLDERIKIITYKENKGLAYALNECIKYSKGEYIARQDDDDISYSQRFTKQVAFLDNNAKYALVGTNADVYDDNGIWGEYIMEEKPSCNSFLWNSPFSHPTVMMRKDVLIKSGCYRVSKETSRCEDYDLFMRMYSLGYRGANIQEKLYKYRVELGNSKYRPMNRRIEEAVVRNIGFKAMKIGIRRIPFVIKPIIIGLIPQRLFKLIRKKQY